MPHIRFLRVCPDSRVSSRTGRRPPGLRELAEVLLRGPSTLTSGERETTIAGKVQQGGKHVTVADIVARKARPTVRFTIQS
jgi:hypothetical protein